MTCALFKQKEQVTYGHLGSRYLGGHATLSPQKSGVD